MAYSGKYTPTNPKKYLGDPTGIIFRSLWERRVFVYLDNNPNIIGWSSEEIVIPYVSPADNRIHRYFPDVFVKTNNKTMVVEIKPHSQSIEPKKKTKITKSYINEVVTYGINQAKWKSAKEYCLDRGWEFVVITEKELFGK